jgi:hypothetical protein
MNQIGSISHFYHALGLKEEAQGSYILSMYINQKKCFAFVELNSIELTTACLELDGIIYRNSVLKVLRANEYKPELLPPSSTPPIKLHLPQSMFATPQMMQHQSSSSIHNLIEQADGRMSDSLILESNLQSVKKGTIAVLGFPYDEGPSCLTSRCMLSHQFFTTIFRFATIRTSSGQR